MQPDIFRYLEVKEISEDGTFTGIASVYGVEDLGGDVIDKGAFTKTISENPRIKILWQHDASEVIGEGTVEESKGKIIVNAKLDLEDETAKKAYRKLKQKLVEGLSIGFQTIKSTWEELEDNGRKRFIRHIQELKLWEVSVVTFPMLPAAHVTRVKSYSDDQELRSFVESIVEAKYQALQAAKVTAPEPQVAADEGKGAAAQESEPEVDHSALSSHVDQFLQEGVLKWNN